MRVQTCEAVFDNGVFRPIGALSETLSEGQRVRLIVETRTPEDILEMASEVYRGLSEEQVEAVERIALDRRES